MSMMRIGSADAGPYGRAEVFVGRYTAGQAVAVQLYTEDGEPLGRLSANIQPSTGNELADDEFAVKCWEENAPMVDSLLACGLFKDTGRAVSLGAFVAAPIWRIADPQHVPPKVALAESAASTAGRQRERAAGG